MRHKRREWKEVGYASQDSTCVKCWLTCHARSWAKMTITHHVHGPVGEEKGACTCLYVTVKQ